MSQRREREIIERIKEDDKVKPPVPTAEKVEAAVQEGFMADAELLSLVEQMVKGRVKAEEVLNLATANEEALKTEHARISELYTSSLSNLEAAVTARTEAAIDVKKYHLDEETKVKIRQARARFDQLMKDLDI